jgi:hypothetical protein
MSLQLSHSVTQLLHAYTVYASSRSVKRQLKETTMGVKAGRAAAPRRERGRDSKERCREASQPN